MCNERTSTLILFVNARRQVAERLAGALNELSEEQGGEAIVRAGASWINCRIGATVRSSRSNSRPVKLKGLCATSTSSLELGIDMGAVDLVIQIEAPPSGGERACSALAVPGHSGGRAFSEGIIFPKYRADLVACAAMTQSMHQGA